MDALFSAIAGTGGVAIAAWCSRRRINVFVMALLIVVFACAVGVIHVVFF